MFKSMSICTVARASIDRRGHPVEQNAAQKSYGQDPDDDPAATGDDSNVIADLQIISCRLVALTARIRESGSIRAAHCKSLSVKLDSLVKPRTKVQA